MKLKTFIVSAVIIVLSVLLTACDRSSPPTIDNTQAELKETKAALTKAQASLEKAQASLEKMQVDMNDMQHQNDDLAEQLENTKIKLKSTLRDYDRIQQQTGVLSNELEKTKTQMTAVTQKLDDLQQQMQLLTKEKDDVIAKVVTTAPADIPKLQEEIKKNPAAAKPLQKMSLATKLQEAESYLNTLNEGNVQAAERILLEIRAIDANYPGLEPLNSRIQNMKALLNSQRQTPQQ